MRSAVRVICLSFLLILSMRAVFPVETTQPQISDDRPLSISEVNLASSAVPKWGLQEITLNLSATYSNAFDPDQIAVDARFKSPSGRIVSVPGFFFQDYSRNLRGSGEVLTRKSLPEWKVRFAPTEVGHYTVSVSARDATGATARSKTLEFDCTASSDHGYVRVAHADSRYFSFDDGRSFFPIGANVCWAGSRGTFDFDTWLPHYGDAGCNYFRLWLGPGWTNLALERIGSPADRYGAGKIDLASAWRLDYVLSLASRHGEYAMLCIDSYNDLRINEEGNYPYWNESTLNVRNGGPIATPAEFWTNAEMQRLYRNKLRYLVARYGWNTHVMSWEFWNEIDGISQSAYRTVEVREWHRKMGAYVRSIDPWAHLRTTSFGSSDGNPSIDSLPEMDYVQTHCYGATDTAAALSSYQIAKEAYGKPHYVGEFGTSAGASDSQLDPEGVALHNGIWSTTCSGLAGAAMLWWWDDFIEPKKMYPQFAALSEFVKGIDFQHEDFHRIANARFSKANSADPDTYRDIEIDSPPSWEVSPLNQPTLISFPGDSEKPMHAAGILHGLINHKRLHNPLTLAFDLPHPSTVHVVVTAVSGYGGAHLIGRIDGQTVLDQDMPDTNSDGKHETMHSYDKDYQIRVPSGKHRLVLENTGTDWLTVRYLIEKAQRLSNPDLRLYGLRGKSCSILWIQNTQHTWARLRTLGRKPTPQSESVLTISNWPKGRYKAHFYDTSTGNETGTRTLPVGEKGLTLQLPKISSDIAVRISRE